MKRILVILYLLPFLMLAQYESKLDSLNRVFEETDVIEEKAEAKVRMVDIYLSIDRQKAKEGIEYVLALGIREDCIRCKALGHYYYGHYYSYEGNIKKSIDHYQKAAALSLEAGDIYLHRKSKAWMAQDYVSDKQYEKARNILNDLIDEVENDDDKTGIEDNYFLLAIIDYERGFLNRAIENYINVEKNIQPDNPYADVYRFKVYNNIAQCYRELKKYQSSLDYVDTGLAMAQKMKDTFNVMNLLLNKGITEIAMDSSQIGTKHLKDTYTYFLAIGDKNFQASSALFLGIGYRKQDSLQRSNTFLDSAEKIYMEMGDSLGLAETLSAKAINNLILGRNEMALEQSDRAYGLIRHREFTPIQIEVLGNHLEALLENGDLEGAVPLFRVKDSLEAILTDRMEAEKFYELETKYQTEKKEQEISLLSAQNQLSEQRRKNQQYLYAGILALFLALAGILFLGYRNKLRTADKMKELDALKSRFFANVSHEFRTPLSLIKSPVQQLKASSDGAASRQLDLIDANADRMLELVDQLLELSKIEGGHMGIILKRGNIPSFLNALVEPFVFQAKEEDIPFEVDTDVSEALHYFDRDILTKIVVNLLSNAFKYRESGPVTFTSKVINNKLGLEISNFNSQVQEKELEKFFERFYQREGTSVGFGIGLALVKDLVTLCEGTVHAHLDKGRVVISAEMPLKKDLKNAVVIEESMVPGSITDVRTIDVEKDGMPVLLIADDHPDIRAVLRDIFKNEFTIVESGDGEQAFELAQKEIPDIIISDVMMPKMDGYALVQQLKEDELTASVPVILLTAKAGDEAHLKGLHIQADGYLTKPFNHEIVKATVAQLLQERKKLQERYSRELILRPVDIAVNTADERFIQRLETVMEIELTNPDFSTDDFASQMNLSRMQLHRKLKSLLGVSATEFVRNERLKAAAELLKNPELSVAEVAYSSGFNEVTYFSKCFKEVYGLSPSAFRKKD
ncbi:response regulator [Allomuricauda taeanensis]|uniref:hybrid sensor histidine kinase/response regulator transcription factor n=1 Tax=Flagellimonas taeanensis TaxID=1005926 RepID=UPI002E7C3758|nr:response regulator [Allomuricauda taeanensis]MEE1964199.1 response regulator [Allomuricauda taeanensis]